MKAVFEDFGGRTSMHGVGFLVAAKSLKAKIFWSCVSLGSMGMFLLMLSRLVIHYLSFPVLVRVEEVNIIYLYIVAYQTHPALVILY